MSASTGPGTSAPASPPHDPATTTRPAAVLVVFLLGLFMTLLDLTIVNVAIPSMTRGLGTSLDLVLWVLSAYSISYAVLLVTAGRLGDIAGPRTLFLAGMVLFTVASAGSGAAPTVQWLIAARAVQGAGAALLAPQGLPMFTTLLPPGRRAGAFAAIGAMSGLAVLAGPTLGGLLVTHAGWRSIFLINIPLGVLTVVLALLLVPDLRPGRRHRLDLPGVVLLTLGLAALVFGLLEGQRYDWGTVAAGVTVPEVVAAGALVLALFGVRQARTQDREPLLPFAVFADRGFTVMTCVLGGLGFAMVGLYLPLTVYLQSVLGLSAVTAGLAVAPQPLAMMVSSAVSGATSERVDQRRLLVAGLLVFIGGTAWLVASAGADASAWDLAPSLVVSGLGLGCVWVPVFGLATRDLEPRLAGVASGVLDTVQEVGSVLATAVLGALLQSRLAHALAERAPGTASGPLGLPAGGPGRGAFGDAFVTAMRPTMLVPLAVLLVAAALAATVRRAPPAG